ncbi:MAG: HAD family hydrolase [Spirochaetota bacterium]
MQQYETIFFDLGGTLIYPDFAFLKARFSTLGLQLEEEHFFYAVSKASQSIDGYLTQNPHSTDSDRVPVYLKSLLQELGFTGGVDSFIEHIILPRHYETNFWNYCPDTIKPFLEKLSNSYKLGIISNSDGRVTEILKSFALEQLFDTIIDSHIVKCEKPNPKIFHIACEKIETPPEKCLYIGDIFSIDILGAQGAGMEAILLDATGKQREECKTIESIFDLQLVLN